MRCLFLAAVITSGNDVIMNVATQHQWPAPFCRQCNGKHVGRSRHFEARNGTAASTKSAPRPSNLSVLILMIVNCVVFAFKRIATIKSVHRPWNTGRAIFACISVMPISRFLLDGNTVMVCHVRMKRALRNIYHQHRRPPPCIRIPS